MKIRLITAVWCTSCLIMRPRYQSIVSKDSSWALEEYDYDTDSKEISSLRIGKTLPVAIIEKDGREIARIIGEKSLREILKALEAL